jgi:hypothetical protein
MDIIDGDNWPKSDNRREEEKGKRAKYIIVVPLLMPIFSNPW